MKCIVVLCVLWLAIDGILSAKAQTKTLEGKIVDGESKLPVAASLTVSGSGFSSFESASDSLGYFSLAVPDVGRCTITITAQGFERREEVIEISEGGSNYHEIALVPDVKLTLEGSVFGGMPSGEAPLDATLTVYLNSDFIKTDSVVVLNGTYKESFTNFGWYMIDFSAPGFATATDTLWVMNYNRKALHKDYHLVPLDSKLISALTNIEFDFDKSTIKPEGYTELDYLSQFLKHNPDKQVEIGGHTDNSGQKLYNLILSRTRAQGVADYLVAKGVNAAQLNVKAWGEEKPLEGNTTSEGKAKNRRVELVLVNQSLSADNNSLAQPRSIHFAFGATAPDADSYTELDRLAEYYNHHTTSRFEIAGYTDNTGPEEYNYTLSQARANRVAEYLRSRGVSTNQLRAKGYGAESPVDSNLSPAGKANNRRVEITMLIQ